MANQISRDLKKQLEFAYRSFSKDPIHKVGRLYDMILSDIIKDLNQNPELEQFILFTNCLNLFYSTRLQAAVNKKSDVHNTKNKIILKVAILLQENWKKGICLSKETQTTILRKEKVEQLRKLLNENLGRHAYSFTTKVFHQLNCNYPILDRNVFTFMRKENFNNRTNFYNASQPYSTFLKCYHNMMHEINWPENKVNELDNAIWVHVDNHKPKYFNLK